jgi:hypothetical protein
MPVSSAASGRSFNAIRRVSDYFVHFWQYHYGLSTLASMTTQTYLSRTDGWSRYFIPFKTLMPVSSAASGRSFNAIRRVKFYLRSTIGDEWLSNLSLTWWVKVQRVTLKPQVRTTHYGLQSFRFAGAKLWNELPNCFRKETSLNQFQNLINTWNDISCNTSLLPPG